MVKKKKITKKKPLPKKKIAKKTPIQKKKTVVALKKKAPVKKISLPKKRVEPIKKNPLSKKKEEGYKKAPLPKKKEEAPKKATVVQVEEQNFDKEIILPKNFFDWKIFGEELKTLEYFYKKEEECQEKNCDQPSTSLGYCRLHYFKNNKKIKSKRQIISEGKLQKAIEILFTIYPEEAIEFLLKNFQDEKSFFQLLRDFHIADIDVIEESLEEESEDIPFTKEYLAEEFDD